MKKILTDEQQANGDGRFVVYLQKLISEPSPLLVHYVGDEKIFRPRAHGNEKKNPDTKVYFATAPSVRQEIKGTKHPSEYVYETMRSKEEARLHPAMGPRNLKQVS